MEINKELNSCFFSLSSLYYIYFFFKATILIKETCVSEYYLSGNSIGIVAFWLSFILRTGYFSAFHVQVLLRKKNKK